MCKSRRGNTHLAALPLVSPNFGQVSCECHVLFSIAPKTTQDSKESKGPWSKLVFVHLLGWKQPCCVLCAPTFGTSVGTGWHPAFAERALCFRLSAIVQVPQPGHPNLRWKGVAGFTWGLPWFSKSGSPRPAFSIQRHTQLANSQTIDTPLLINMEPKKSLGETCLWTLDTRLGSMLICRKTGRQEDWNCQTGPAKPCFHV